MTSLIACLSTGKGTWAQVNELIQGAEWDKIFLITNVFGKEKFQNQSNTKLLVFDLNKPSDILCDEIVASLHKENLGAEVAVNIYSGSGNEHMALLAAILKLGLGLRFIFSKNNKVEELKLFSFD
ncbi:hypothetical protein CMO90_00235 [Candidatus Woesearchaeota archaeon]|jgi:hypothetical protein|nr:hypothetical protein [Candidatus Woesearchaeota archaeon]|tara:strand:+ start:1862 stop:2236 length:375 start_codon:yes stop_codon:yes gene_type:complete